MGTRQVGMAGGDRSRLRFGPFEVDPHTHELWKFGTRIKLFGQPLEILLVLLERPGELVTREELRSRLWPADTFVDFNHGLNAAVNKLRDALSDSAESPRYVETLPRRGYRFISAVEQLPALRVLSAQQQKPSVGLPLVTQPEPDADVPPFATAIEDPELPRSRWPLAVSGLVAYTLLIAFLLLRDPSSSRNDAAEGHAGGLSSIAAPVHRSFKAILGQRDENAEQGNPGRIVPLTTMAENAAQPSFSPDGNLVALHRDGDRAENTGIFIKELATGQSMQLTDNPEDCCPAWSPDGRWVAFSRFNDQRYTIYLAPADGGVEAKRNAELNAAEARNVAFADVAPRNAERKLNTGAVSPQRGELGWSPDGKSLAFSGNDNIQILTIANSQVEPLTKAPPLAHDWGPSFSPDGTQIAFIRGHEAGSSTDIMVVPLTGGEPIRMVAEPKAVNGPPQWSPDGRSLIYSSSRNGEPALWRVAIDKPDQYELVSSVRAPAWAPTVARRGYRLAYQRRLESLSVWQLDLSTPTRQRPKLLIPATTQTDQGPGPQISPDGKRLAYMSDRSGTMEIWISDLDGSHAVQLTAVGTAGTPRWSPDGENIVFDVNWREHGYIAVVSVKTGAWKPLVQDSHENLCPSWSRDGKFIYFASPRSGAEQVWKVPAQGGTPVQVTQQGGYAAQESADGKFLYYSKTGFADPAIWQVPVRGGVETPLAPAVVPGTWANWAVVDRGILYVSPKPDGGPSVRLFEPSKHRISNVRDLWWLPFWIGATPDAKTLVLGAPGGGEFQVMLAENFR